MTLLKRTLSSLTAEEYQQCLRLMRPERRTHVEQIRHQKTRERTILGEWMAKTALSQWTALPIEQIRLERDAKGKPQTVGLPLHFNVSHSDEMVCCVLSERPVGVDVERLRPLNPALADRFCTADDKAYLEAAQSPEERLERTWRIWTAKEAYFKWKGTGITNLKSISLSEILPHCKQWIEGEYLFSIVQEDF